MWGPSQTGTGLSPRISLVETWCYQTTRCCFATGRGHCFGLSGLASLVPPLSLAHSRLSDLCRAHFIYNRSRTVRRGRLLILLSVEERNSRSPASYRPQHVGAHVSRRAFNQT